MSGKTPIVILQEIMEKRNRGMPVYKFFKETAETINCGVEIGNMVFVGTAVTKKGAKLKAAFLALDELKKQGIYSYSPDDEIFFKTMFKEIDSPLSSTAELKNFCTEYRLPIPEYTFLYQFGLPYLKSYAVSCKVGSLERIALDTTKKCAKQLSAALVLEYFSTYAPQRIAELQISNQNELIGVNDFAKVKSVRLTSNPKLRPNLGLSIGNYHHAFKNSLEKSKLEDLVNFLGEYSEECDPVQFIENFFKKVPLNFYWDRIPSDTIYIMSLQVPHTTPAIVMLGFGKDELDAKKLSALDTIKYVRDLLTL